MFLREGSQLRATVRAVCCAALAYFGATVVVNAAGDVPADATNGVQLPREVLPWRRHIEQQAEELLRTARRLQRMGNAADAERHLRELLRKFPRTNAAADAHNEFARLRETRVVGTGRRNLGAPLAQERRVRRENMPRVPETLAPVAGWQTVVRANPADLHEALIEAAGDRVFFADGSAKLTPRARGILNRQARWLNGQLHVDVRIVGHADDSGTTSRNLRLSHDRAVAVRRQLIRAGVSAKRLRIYSHGNAQPIAICAVKTCAAQNRRVVTELMIRQKAGIAPDRTGPRSQ